LSKSAKNGFGAVLRVVRVGGRASKLPQSERIIAQCEVET
jgi:hypothetical protein